MNVQGIDAINELRNFDDRGVERHCQVLRKPGGTIPNPNAQAARGPAVIPNPGYNVSVKAEENLEQAA